MKLYLFDFSCRILTRLLPFLLEDPDWRGFFWTSDSDQRRGIFHAWIEIFRIFLETKLYQIELGIYIF